MKKLTLLLLALPLAACATQTSQLREKQFMVAKDDCAANYNVGASSPYYRRCVNAFLSRYRWQAGQNPDGSLHVIIPRGPYTPGYF